MRQRQQLPQHESRGFTRREFAKLASLAALAAGCSGDSTGPTAAEGNGVTITGNLMTIPLAMNPSLDRANGIILVPQAKVVVVRVSAGDFRALTSVCTHQGCTVDSFNGDNIGCPCHGSQFGVDGSVFRGPAAAPLKTYATSLNATTGIVTVTLA